jgi:hypothetical protein
VQQIMQTDQQWLEDKTSDADFAQHENLVMSMNLDKMTPWVRKFYMSKAKELAE